MKRRNQHKPKDDEIASEQHTNVSAKANKNQDVRVLAVSALTAKKQYVSATKKLQRVYAEQTMLLPRIANMTPVEARKQLLKIEYQRMRVDLNRVYAQEKQQVDQRLKEYAQNLIVNAMQNVAGAVVTQHAPLVIQIEDEAQKGRLIGRNGRNKQAFETITGVNLIVDKKKDMEVIVSSTNPVRREIAANLLQQLLKTNYIDPNQIETLYRQEEKKFETEVTNIGRQVLEEKLHVFDLNPSIYKYVGRLKYRFSYGQNVLQHALECAAYAKAIAVQLGINPNKAQLAAFLHDIGKAKDFDENFNHVNSGLAIARECGLPDYIENAIASHHGAVPANSVYAALVKVVDTLSAARPGARINSYEEHVKRITRIETICEKISGVYKAYALQSGHALRIICQPDITNNQLDLLEHEIRTTIEADELTNRFEINVEVIREQRKRFTVNTKTTVVNAGEPSMYSPPVAHRPTTPLMLPGKTNEPAEGQQKKKQLPPLPPVVKSTKHSTTTLVHAVLEAQNAPPASPHTNTTPPTQD